MAQTLEKKVWTYQDYRSLDDDKRYEILKGNLEMVPAPTPKHQRNSRRLEMKLCQFVDQHALGEIFDAPIDVIFDEHNLVQPDILFISAANTKIINPDKGIFGSPDLIVEIISKSSQHRDRYEKKTLYQRFKVKEYWLVDPFAERIEVLALNEAGEYELYDEAYLIDEEAQGNKTVHSKVLEGFQIHMNEVF